MEQSDLLRYAIESLEQLNLTYAIVGSFASGAYGEPRFTQDIDIVINLQAGQIGELCRRFPSPEFYVSQAAVEEAVYRRGQFNVIHPTSGNKIDFMMSGTGQWSSNQLARRQSVELFPNCNGYLASPEDVILGKMIYYREGGSEKHLRDITGILKITGDAVDRDYIAQFAVQLGVTEVWEAVVSRLKRADSVEG